MRKAIYLAGMGAIFAAAFVVIQRATPQTTQPRVTWFPSSVYGGITSTTTITKHLTFASNQALQNVFLEAVPQIAPFIKIEPNTFAQVPAAQPQTVQVTFSAPAGAKFGAYDGTIHLRIGSSTLPQTLQTSVTFAIVILPPDPGDAGKATLRGIDADGDGVRDDVERWIALTFPNSAKTRAALTQGAIALQQAVLANGSQPQALSAIHGQSDALFCLAGILGDIGVAGPPSQGLQTVVLNTFARTNAYLQANSLVGGSVYVLPSIDARLSRCQFTIGALPN